jgi:predicted alpha/beta superfamily hydrolase
MNVTFFKSLGPKLPIRDNSCVRRRVAIYLAFAIAAALGPGSIAQGPITIPNSEVANLHSKINATDYKLFIILPKSYGTSTKRYPVFYLLDGNDTATIAWLARSRQHSDVPEIIFVGVGYPEPLAGPPVALPGKPAVPAAQRSADYATYSTREPWSPPADKGAPAFLKVLQEEVIPYIDTRYRTDTTDRALGGHSLGGQFTTYALFHAPETFQKFWIGSPSLRWDDSVRFKDEAGFAATHRELSARVIAVVGGQESRTFMRDPLFEMGEKVRSRHYPRLSWKTIVLPNEDHGTLPLAGMPQILDFLYGPAQVELSSVEKNEVLGQWVLPNGNSIRFLYDDGLLFATGLPFLNNADPAKEQLITPLGSGKFALRTLLSLQIQRDGSNKPRLLIQKMRSTDTVTALRKSSKASTK